MKRRMIGAGIAGISLLVAGCGAGQITQTDTQVAGVNGGSSEVGDIAVRNAELAFPANVEPAAYLEGSDAEVVMSVINTGLQADELQSVTSDAAENVAITGETSVPADTTLAVGPGKPDASQLDGQVTLEGLKRELRPGQDVTATLTFRDAGTLEVKLPMKVPEEPRHDAPAHDEERGGGGH
ncbi:copper chaperone PCu(A)C [Prauserella alba]|uniref:Copper(I)-binding protein n=1 Tax=Prauserella alba TaxID=176898 RepID=A0ABP4FTD3_9PSEU|nr:copper chaperone PCu(A)C [Prauserella alba]MCP2181567.1 Copper(I)-binding protein [Prauserella alba]